MTRRLAALLIVLAVLPARASPECDALLSAPGMTKKERLKAWKQCEADLVQRHAEEEERRREEEAQRQAEEEQRRAEQQRRAAAAAAAAEQRRRNCEATRMAALMSGDPVMQETARSMVCR